MNFNEWLDQKISHLLVYLRISYSAVYRTFKSAAWLVGKDCITQRKTCKSQARGFQFPHRKSLAQSLDLRHHPRVRQNINKN